MSEPKTEKNEEELKAALVSVFAKMTDETQVEALLADLFTEKEIRDQASRLQVAKMLDAGLSYAEIEKITGVSATTISRVSKCLAHGPGGYRFALSLLD